MFLADALKENWQVVVVVQLVYCYLPLHDVLHAVGERDRQVATVIEAPEFRAGDRPWALSICEGVGNSGLGLLLVKAEVLTTDALRLGQRLDTLLLGCSF